MVNALELPAEDVGRGFRFALLTVPPVIVMVSLVWQLQAFAAIVGLQAILGVAVGTGIVLLYRLGSRGRIGRRGVALIGLLVLVTLTFDYLIASVIFQSSFADEYGLTFLEAFVSRETWMSLPDFWLLNNAIMTFEFVVAFSLAAVSAFTVLRFVFTEGKVRVLRYEDLEYDA